MNSEEKRVYSDFRSIGGRMTKIMPSAISVRQPWAWLIIHGGKDIENRTWPTNRRGDVLIHAGTGFDLGSYAALREKYDLPARCSLQRGGIIGIVTIVNCVQDHSSPWAQSEFWNWVFENPRPIKFMPCKGRLNFFTPNIDYSQVCYV